MTREQELEQALAAMTHERDEALNAFFALKAAFKAYGQALAAEREAHEATKREMQEECYRQLQGAERESYRAEAAEARVKALEAERDDLLNNPRLRRTKAQQ